MLNIKFKKSDTIKEKLEKIKSLYNIKSNTKATEKMADVILDMHNMN